MSIRPADIQAGNARRFWLGRVAFLGFASIALLQVNSAQADGGAAWTKAISRYKDLKSYEATIVTKNSGVDPKTNRVVSITKTQKVQYKSPNFFHIEITATQTGLDAKTAKEFEGNNLSLYSDGKTMTIYKPSLKKFQKRAVPPSIPLVSIVQELGTFLNVNPKMLKQLPATGKSQGREGMLFEITVPAPPATADAAMKKGYEDYKKTLKQSPQFIVDKQNNNFLNFAQISTKQSVNIDYSNQNFSPAFSGSSFNFIPPKGATELKQPVAAPGGAPPINLGGKK